MSNKMPITTTKQIAFRAARNSNYDQGKVFDYLFNPKQHLTDEQLKLLPPDYIIDDHVLAPLKERIDGTIKEQNTMEPTYKEVG